MRQFIVISLLWFSTCVFGTQEHGKKNWISWLVSLTEQGIDVSPQHWQILAGNPSSQQVESIVLKYALYLDAGRLDKKYYQPGWAIPDILSTPAPNLSPGTLQRLQPDIPQYAALVQALAVLKEWRDSADEHFPNDLILFEGDQHPAVARLNQWLADLDLAHGLPDEAYSQHHKDILTEVQLKYDLSPDGRLGALTRQALLAINLHRIRTIKANLERLRWLPKKLPYPHIFVDIAGFNVAHVKNKNQTDIYKAIIGSSRKQTPIFQNEVESITVNPIWKVPHGIAARSLLKEEKKHPGFFRKEGFRIYTSWDDNAPEVEPESANWKAFNVGSFRHRLEQEPGPLNRLGKLKLNLPNAYGIYLHGTDKPELFEKTKRALSSGCTRVEGIDYLAGNIALEQGVAVLFEEAMKSDATQKIELNSYIPIYFMYFTAWPDSSGKVRFREDIYKLDNALTSWF